MIPYARLTPGPGFRPAQSALYYGQRFFCHAGLRRAAARAIASAIAQLGPKDGAGPASAKLASSAKSLERDGWAILDEGVRADALTSIRAYLRDQPVIAPSGLSTRLEHLPPGTGQAAYSLETILGCPEILELVNSHDLIGLASAYLGCRPTLSSIGIRWSLPNPRAVTDTQAFHRDPDDWRFLKVFVYLTDVGATSGPHLYVSGTHKTSGKMFGNTYSDQEVEQKYGPGRIMSITGPAGTTFAADTYGVHKGKPPVTGPRLMLQIQYSLLPNYALRYHPVELPAGPQFDRYLMRLMLKRKAPTSPARPVRE